MGRHSGPPDPPPQPAGARASRDPAEQPPRHLLERLALAVAAAVGTGAVMAWAGADPIAALLGAIGSGVVVLVAAWVAGSLPGRPPHGDDGRPGSAS